MAMSGQHRSARDIEALFSREYAQMLGLALLLVDDAATAEDIVQDAFAGVAKHWGSIERPGAYLRTAVVNGSRMALRRRRSDRHKADRLKYQPVGVEGPPDLLELDAALAALPLRQREAIVLRYLHDLADEDIAAAMSCRQPTVRSLVRRGLQRLRKDLS